MVKYVEVHFKKLYLLQNIYLFLEWLKSKKCFFFINIENNIVSLYINNLLFRILLLRGIF